MEKYVVFLRFSELQQALGLSAAECEEARRRAGISRSEAMVHCSPAYEYFWVEQKMERVTDRRLVPRQLSCRCYGRPSWSRASSAARQRLSRLDSSGTVLFYAFLVQLSVSSHFRSLSCTCVLPAAVIICPVLMCWGTGAHYHLTLVYFSLYARLSCHQFFFVSWFLISRDCFGPLCLGLALANSLLICLDFLCTDMFQNLKKSPQLSSISW